MVSRRRPCRMHETVIVSGVTRTVDADSDHYKLLVGLHGCSLVVIRLTCVNGRALIRHADPVCGER